VPDVTEFCVAHTAEAMTGVAGVSRRATRFHPGSRARPVSVAGEVFDRALLGMTDALVTRTK